MAASGGNYAWYKWTLFVTLYIGYVLYILTRKSFTFVAPAVMDDLELSKNDLGLIASSQTLAYAISKFAGGALSDHVNPSHMFSSGLVAIGLISIIFPMFESVSLFAILSFLNGLFQGAGWPAIAKLLRAWYPRTEWATWWSLLSTSMNTAGSAGPLIAAYIVIHRSWQTCMTLFGVHY